MIMLDMEGVLLDGDTFAVTWKGQSYSDCNPINQLGQSFRFNHSYWPGVWMGIDTGIKGITDVKMDEVQFCWKPSSE